MDSTNDNSFMSWIKINRLRENENYPGLYNFNMSIGPIRIKGMSYRPENGDKKGSLQWPRCTRWQPIIAAGPFVNDLRALLDSEIIALTVRDGESDETKLAA